MKKNKSKILVCLSGGVDSSVAAALLVRAGYNVTAAFMVNYDDREAVASCWRDDYRDALRVAAKLDIPLLRWDFVKEYEEMVLSYMYREYKAGRTPNPDVLCNKFIKFGFWLDKAKELGFDYIATGHYARLSFPRRRESSVRLLMSKDKNKDQTYFLNQLSQNQLARAMFPVGDYTKSEVRAIAKKFDLSTAEKAESMGICFIGEVPMKEFLQRKIKKHPGKIILSSATSGGAKDEMVGEHEGLAFYTLGERVSQQARAKRGKTRPLFVVGKDTRKNTLIAGFENDPLLYKKEITASRINWISGQTPKFPLKCEVRLRHRQPLRSAIVIPAQAGIQGNNQSVSIQFTTPERAPTPGQFAVFYVSAEAPRGAKEDVGEECLGGGVIE